MGEKGEEDGFFLYFLGRFLNTDLGMVMIGEKDGFCYYIS